MTHDAPRPHTTTDRPDRRRSAHPAPRPASHSRTQLVSDAVVANYIHEISVRRHAGYDAPLRRGARETV